jgi:hypothetical protein
MVPAKGTERCLVEKDMLHGTRVKYRPGANGSVMCQYECDVYIALTYMKDLLLSGRFVKGDLRSVSNSFFTHYGVVDDSNRQLHSPRRINGQEPD